MTQSYTNAQALLDPDRARSLSDLPDPGMPCLGRRFSTSQVTVDLDSAEPFQANFICSELVISLQLGRRDYSVALDSDKMKDRTLLPGSVAVNPEGSSIKCRTGNVNSEFLGISFGAEMLTQALDDCGASASCLRIFPNLEHPEFMSLGRAMRTFLVNPGGRNSLYGETLSLAILLNVVATLGKRSAAKATGFNRAQIKRVCDYIEDNLDASLGLQELSSLADVSVYHFSRGFRKTTGLSVHQYVIERRVSRARELLAQEDSLADVAYAVGFSSQAHMTDVFRKKLGVTPGRYRRDMQA